MKLTGSLAFALTALIATAAQAQTVNVKIGVLTDMSSLYSGIGGPGSVAAAKLAIEDFNPAAHNMTPSSTYRIPASRLPSMKSHATRTKSSWYRTPQRRT
jgi:hypothetical protein